MGDTMAIKAFAVVVLGGMGSFIGSIVGGLILGMTESFSSGYISAAYQDAIAFVIIIAVLVLRPSGLFAGRFGKREVVG
jgi:branched-chain amino acid transport system permease protein